MARIPSLSKGGMSTKKPWDTRQLNRGRDDSERKSIESDNWGLDGTAFKHNYNWGGTYKNYLKHGLPYLAIGSNTLFLSIKKPTSS